MPALHSQAFFDTTFSLADKGELLKRVIAEKEAGVSAYYKLPFSPETLEVARGCSAWVEENLAVTLEKIFIVGVGGSSLGLKAIDALLRHKPHRKKNLKIYFLEHTDPVAIEQSLTNVSPYNSLFVFISKSGLTIETSSVMKYLLERFSLLREDSLRSRLLVITDQESPLHQWAKKFHLKVATIDQRVGGRFSVLGSVGIVPLAILGYDVQALLGGAADFSDDFFSGKVDHLLEKALYYFSKREQIPMNVLFSYSSLFREFNAWYVQLWGESLGKINHANKRVGLTPVSLIGSIDQHSFLQLIVQGPLDKSVTFLRVKEMLSQQDVYRIPELSLDFLEPTDFVNGAFFSELLERQLEATMESIVESGAPVDLLTLSSFSEESLGALIMYYQLLTSCMGILLGIETYDQPGVEFGKKKLKEKFSQ